MNPTSQPFKDHPFAGAYTFRNNQLVPMDAKEALHDRLNREAATRALYAYHSIWSLNDLSTRLSDFIQEGIESGTFDNYGDLKLCVTNFLTLHQK